MAAIKISSKVDETVWEDPKELADDSHQRRRVRPSVKRHFEDSIVENEKLGTLLAR